MKKHFFFDMDGTICPSRQKISPMVAMYLQNLAETKDIVVISGAEESRIIEQIGKDLADYITPQSGAECEFWKIAMSERDEVEVRRHVRKLQELFPEVNWEPKTYRQNEFLQNRGCQISFSFTGHNCPIELKSTFDPTGERRMNILKKIPFTSIGLEARVAGSSCIDYTHKEYTKGKSIAKFIKQLNWNPEDCIYFGDKLMKGGNDETVIGVIDTASVSSPENLLEIIKKYV